MVVLSELAGQGWVPVEPPLLEDEETVVARYDGKPVKAGFKMETVEDSPELFHAKYRSGSYDLEVKVDFDIGRGQVKAEEADGYDSDR